jgi:hypothetical protein
MDVADQLQQIGLFLAENGMEKKRLFSWASLCFPGQQIGDKRSDLGKDV